MRPAVYRTVTSVLVVAVAAAGMAATAVIQGPRSSSGTPPLAGPPAPPSAPATQPGHVKASTAPVTATRIPSPGPPYVTPVLAAYGRSTPAAATTAPAPGPASPSGGQPSPAHAGIPAAAAPVPSPAAPPEPRGAGPSAPAAVIALASPSSCTASVSVFGIGGCVKLGG